MYQLKFGELPLGAKFFHMGERYVKSSPTAGAMRCKRAFSKNPLNWGDELAIPHDQLVSRVVYNYMSLLPQGVAAPFVGYISGNYYEVLGDR